MGFRHTRVKLINANIPKVGDWYSLCCEEDLKQIEDEDERAEIEKLVRQGSPFPTGVWPTEQAALDDMRAHPETWANASHS